MFINFFHNQEAVPMKYLKYAKLIIRLVWLSIGIYVFVFQYNADIYQLSNDIRTMLNLSYQWIVSLPTEVWNIFINFLSQLKHFFIDLWHNQSWLKLCGFMIIGMVKRFIIEDIVFEMITKNFIYKFKENKVIWIRLKLDSILRVVKELGNIVYHFVALMIVFLTFGIFAHTVIIPVIQTAAINKILSILKTFFLYVIPLIFAFILEGFWQITIFIEYIILMFSIKIVLRFPILGSYILKYSKYIDRDFKKIDAVLKKWAIEYPKGVLKMKGYIYNSILEKWIMDMRSVIGVSYSSPGEIKQHLDREKRKKIITKKQNSLYRKIRLRIKKSVRLIKRRTKNWLWQGCQSLFLPYVHIYHYFIFSSLYFSNKCTTSNSSDFTARYIVFTLGVPLHKRSWTHCSFAIFSATSIEL